jgi:hypothetical protein
MDRRNHLRYGKAMRSVKIPLIFLLLLVAGCEQPLETGYVPHRLNASDSDRRSYYAPAFTPESHPSKGQGGMPSLIQPHY